MSELPKLARVASVIAFVMAVITAIAGVAGPIIVLPLALIPLFAGVGIRRGRVWSAYGMATYLFGQVLLVPVVVSRAGSTVGLAAIVPSAAFSLGLGILFVLAGRSLAAAGGARGRALPWIAVTALCTLPLVFFQAFVNPTGSMVDTLLVGDRLLVRTFPRSEPVRDDIIAFIYPVDRRQTFLKRVVGVGGDRIRIAKKVLYLNGKPLTETYAVHKLDYEDSYRDDFPSEPNTMLYPPALEMLRNNVVNGEVVVPPGKYFVLGDNRDQSLDSRYWGFVGTGDVIGKPSLI